MRAAGGRETNSRGETNRRKGCTRHFEDEIEAMSSDVDEDEDVEEVPVISRVIVTGAENGGDGEAEEELNAWGLPTLKYTEEDALRQQFVETIHTVEWRDRRSHGFKNPDEVKELRLDHDGTEDEPDDEETACGFDVTEDEPERLGVAVELAITNPGEEAKDEMERGKSVVGGYREILMPTRKSGDELTSEDYLKALETRLKNLRGVPPHLHRFVKPVALELPIGSRVKKVCGGDDHALILLESDTETLESLDPTYIDHDGRVLVMGSDKHLQLGLNTSSSQDVPVNLDTIGDTKGMDIAAGARHSVLITKGDECLTWGTDTDGCTGQGESGKNCSHKIPKWMYWIANASTKVRSCAAGDAHTLIVTTSDRIYSFGSGKHGQLGHGDGTDYSKPRLVEALVNVEVNAVVCGGAHSLVLTQSGFVYGFGKNSHGQLGTSDYSDIFLTRRLVHNELVGGVPPKIDMDELTDNIVDLEYRDQLQKLNFQKSPNVVRPRNTFKIAQIAAGKDHTVALTDNGRVYVCGSGRHGQLGLHTSEDCFSMTLMSDMINVSVVQVGAGDFHTVMLTTLGDVFVCGSNENGQHGDGTIQGTARPRRMQPDISSEDRAMKNKSRLDEIKRHPLYQVRVEKVFASKSTTFVLPRGGQTLFVCGSGAFGHPTNDHPTDLSILMGQNLSKWNENQLLMMASTFANLEADEHTFQNLSKQMVMYGVYTDHVLAHVLKSAFEELLMRPELCNVYVKMIKMIGRHSLGCTELLFRRIILFAIEDVGVRMLNARNEAQRRRLLRSLGPIAFQRLQKKDAEKDLHGKFARFITDQDGYSDYLRFKDDCVALRRCVTALFQSGVLVKEDVSDIQNGFSGSKHSISLVNSVDAEQKHVFFTSVATFGKSRPMTSHTEGVDSVKEKKVPDLLTTSQEEAAWGSAYLHPTEVPANWKTYTENVKIQRKMRAATHGIGAGLIDKCESMLAPSTRNLHNVGDLRGIREENWKMFQR